MPSELGGSGRPAAHEGVEHGPDRTLPELALVAARAADAKLGQDTVVLEMGELLEVVDAFVITSGRNPRHVHTLVEEIESAVKKAGGPGPRQIEGLREATWVLMDYGDFLVHVFGAETREYFDLEHLWSRARRIPVGGEDVLARREG